MFLFELGEHQEKGLAVLLRTLLKCLFEQVPCAFELLASVPLDKLGKVDIPDLESHRVRK